MIPLMIILASKLLADVPVPHVEITPAWLPTGETVWRDGEVPNVSILNSSVISVPANVDGIRMLCTAKYPIQWEFVSEINEMLISHGALGLNHIVRNTRTASDIFNTATFEYIAELQLSGGNNALSGNYSCRSSDDASVYSFVYIFWEGNSPPFMIHAGETDTIYVDHPTRGNEDQVLRVIIPCRISVINMSESMLLQKEHNGTWQNVLAPTLVSYDPKVGFTIESSRQGILGKYQCSVGDSPFKGDIRTFSIVEGISPASTPVQEYVQRNASFAYLPGTLQFRCCSDSGTMPAMLVVYCDHPTVCASKKNFLRQQLADKGKRRTGGRNSCTSVKITYQSSGVIKCVGSGINVFREYFFPTSVGLASLYYNSVNRYNTSKNRMTFSKAVFGKPYYHWRDADPKDLIRIEAPRPVSTLYVGQTVVLHCKPSHYYYANGAKWIMVYSNRSRIVLDGVDTMAAVLTRHILVPGYSSINFKVEASLTQVGCTAPVWNTTEWGTNMVPLNISIPQSPSIDNSFENIQVPDIYWKLNETNKTLTCSAQGVPPPSIVWVHNDRVVQETRRDNRTSFLTFTKVNFTTQGILVCRVRNVGGRLTKTYHIHIQVDANSAGLVTGVVMLTVLFAVAVIVLGVLIKRIRDQATSITHLRSVAFKDVLEQQHGFNFTDSGIDSNGSCTTPSTEKADSIVHEAIANLSISQNISYQKF